MLPPGTQLRRRLVGRLLTAVAVTAAPLAVVATTATAAHADDTCGVAGNLVTDCGFESSPTGHNVTPSGWTWTQAASGAWVDVTPANARTGQNALYLGNTAQQDDTISQAISGTVPGATYTASFWSTNINWMGEPTHLKSTVTGTADGTETLVDQTNVVLSQWTQYSVTFTAGSSAPVLNIGGYDAEGYELADDVSVVLDSPVLPASLADATYGSSYTGSVAATGGTAPYSYAVTAGTLPDGLSLDATTGAITGTPTATGDADFTVTATDSSSTPLTGSHDYTMTVDKAAPTVTVTGPTDDGVVGATDTVAATGDQSSDTGVISYQSDTTDVCSVSDATVTYLHPGTCTVEADQAATDDYSAASSTVSVTVDQAATTTSVSVQPTTITADVAVSSPGAGDPSGTVTFQVGADVVGTASVDSGTATLDYQVPTGASQQVAATYSGDTDFAGSSGSTSRNDPAITAKVTSSRPKSRFRWYRTPVRVLFTCHTDGAALSAPCPSPVTIARNVAGGSVTRTITADDGGAATVSLTGLNVDRTAPRVRVTGIRNGATYDGKAPAAHCVGADALSGIATCKVVSRTHAGVTHYTATATDKAGNRHSVRGSYHVLSTYVVDAGYRNGTFQVKAGKAYSLVVHAASRPRYVDAAVAPRHPAGLDNYFKKIGPDTWAITVTMPGGKGLTWNLGVKIGSHVHDVRVHIG